MKAYARVHLRRVVVSVLFRWRWGRFICSSSSMWFGGLGRCTDRGPVTGSNSRSLPLGLLSYMGYPICVPWSDPMVVAFPVN